MTKKSSPSAQRSNVKNPNNSAYQADRANRIAQGHPAPPPSQSASASAATGTTPARPTKK